MDIINIRKIKKALNRATAHYKIYGDICERTNPKISAIKLMEKNKIIYSYELNIPIDDYLNILAYIAKK